MSTEEDEERMTADEAAAALDAIPGGDPEEAHAAADGILLRAVDPVVRAAYARVVERAGGWWYA